MSTEPTKALAVTGESSSLLSVIDRAARDPSTDVAKMEKLLELAERIHAREAKAQYDQALNAAQGEMRPISRDCSNPQTRSKYASYEAIDTAIRPIYTNHGFAMSFGSKASPHQDHVVVTCRVSHRAGHTEHVELDMPADGKGARGGDVQSKTHATGSALSYAKRYIANLVWNLSFGEMDDDGNRAGQRPPPPPKNQERPPARSADVLPKQATETTRKWMLDELQKVFEAEDIWGYAVRHRIITDAQVLTDWPLNQVPTSKQGVADLANKINDHIVSLAPDAPKDNGDELPPEIANVPIHVPPKGVRKADYTPVTIGELYAARHDNDDARSRLFGFMLNFEAKGWTNDAGKHFPPSKEDLELREALDRLAEWREKRGEK